MRSFVTAEEIQEAMLINTWKETHSWLCKCKHDHNLMSSYNPSLGKYAWVCDKQLMSLYIKRILHIILWGGVNWYTICYYFVKSWIFAHALPHHFHPLPSCPRRYRPKWSLRCYALKMVQTSQTSVHNMNVWTNCTLFMGLLTETTWINYICSQWLMCHF